jgi:drug/metabolite transporter (DMT)-like permease
VVYSTAAVTLLVLAILAGHNLFNYSLQVHGIMILLAIIPTGIGHSLINWAARKIPVYKVNFSILGEPIIASILAYFFFSEIPYGFFYLGAGFILMGIFMALMEQSGKQHEK